MPTTGFLTNFSSINKQRYISIICILVFFGIAAGMEFFLTRDFNLERYETQIERALHLREQAVQAALEDNDFLYRQFTKNADDGSDFIREDLRRLNNLVSAPYTLLMYQKDSLVFWTNNQAVISRSKIRALRQHGNDVGFFDLANGSYVYHYKELPEVCPSCTGVGLIPIKYDYSLKSRYLNNEFVTEGGSVPNEVYLTNSPTTYGIESVSSKTVTYIDAASGIKDKFQLKILLAAYLLGCIAMGFLINSLAIVLVKRYSAYFGAIFLLFTVFLLRYLTNELEFTSNFSDLHTFSDTFRKPVLNLSDSLGDLLIDIAILLWMMVFFHRHFKVNEHSKSNFATRFILAVFQHGTVILGIMMVVKVLHSMVLDSDITFDFDNVFNLNFYSFLSIIGIILLQFALFLFAHRMMTSIRLILDRKYPRILSALLAVALSAFLIPLLEFELEIWHVLAGITFFLLFFDVFIEIKSPTLEWLVAWVVVFAFFSSLLLFRFNKSKDFKLRATHAEKLAESRDYLAEDRFKELRFNLQQNAFLQSLTRDTFVVSQADIENSIDLNTDRVEYLYHNYNYDIWMFYKGSKSSIVLESKDRYNILQSRYEKGKQLAVTGLRFYENEKQQPVYFQKIELEGLHSIVIYLEFLQKKSSPSKVYSELLIGHKFKGMNQLDEYDYAIYQNGVLIDEAGDQDYDILLRDENIPPRGEIRRSANSAVRWESIYHADNGKIVKIGKNIGGYIKPMSLFSYLFSLLILAVILLAGINFATNSLPNVLNFSISRQFTLRNRIQFSVIIITIMSFVGIGIVTVWHFSVQSIRYHSGRLDRKASAAQTSAQRELNILYKKSTDTEVNISDLIAPTSKIHRLDVNLFDTLGNLISSSEKNIFQKGIITPKMGAFAYFSAPHEPGDIIVQDESVGALKYKSAYVPLTDPNGATVAFLGLPYYSQERDLKGDVTEFMGTLLNVYVLLLLLAGVIAVTIANSITRPIKDIGDSMKRVSLGSTEPLTWKNQDELGELINQYNKMVTKLQESSRMEAKAERESAWRGMAKQVAHEIKNPLTPMKLSIQYMMHAYQTNPKNIGPLIKRVSQTLIEQIDSLVQIANNFSNFAKMPQAENSKFQLNDLAISVHALFGNVEDGTDVGLTLPDKLYYVYADKNHLTRVLNNLIKNAIQAIPDERDGKVEITMFERNEMVVLQVKDNGTGITDEMRDKVFVPNFTTKSSGTGLGLAICKNIMDACKGEIYFETEVGIGTSFFIELPIVEVEDLSKIE